MWMYRCSNFKLDHKYNYAIFIDTLCELKTNLNEKHWPLGLHSVYQSHLYMTLSVFFSNFFCHCRLFIIFGMLICSFSVHLERDINYTFTMRARLICNALDQMEFWAYGGIPDLNHVSHIIEAVPHRAALSGFSQTDRCPPKSFDVKVTLEHQQQRNKNSFLFERRSTKPLLHIRLLRKGVVATFFHTRPPPFWEQFILFTISKLLDLLFN